jgi:hypothetical protein
MAGTSSEERRYGPRGDDHPDDPITNQDRLHTNLLPMDDLSDDSSPPTPRFLQDQRSYRSMKWVPVPIRRVSRAVANWAKGPDPPHRYTIKPLFPSIQEFPLRLLDRHLPKLRHKLILLVVFYFCWILAFILVFKKSEFATEIEGYGAPASIGCGNTYWVPGNQCGLGGNDCRPFSGHGFAFRCPANCRSYEVANPRAVGAGEALYQPLVIGGPSDDNDTAVYRSDSFICGSAIHAGIIDNSKGGCGVVTLIGTYNNYVSSNRHGIESLPFDSNFPSSFTFHSGTSCEAKDPRWELFGVSLTFTVILSLFTTSPAIFYYTIFTGIFVHVGFASDPPGDLNDVKWLSSNLIGKFLPAMFCGFVIYKYMGVRRALSGLTAQIEKTILWLGACWVGALTNYTLDWIPIQRLNKHDLEQQPGAKFALACIIILLATIMGSQVFFFRREGRLIRYLGIYGILVISILVSLTIPGLSLRIHHYILALLLLPGTSMQTRPALVYQGLLLGFFINGIVRWDFDPVLQTSAALQGDAQKDTRLPLITAPSINLAENISTISFSWLDPPDPYDGISVLVNDVERFRGYTDEGFDSDRRFVWTKDPAKDQREYFRFAYMDGSSSGDYTKAGIWEKNGTWTQMQKGPSKVRSLNLDGEELRR